MTVIIDISPTRDVSRKDQTMDGYHRPHANSPHANEHSASESPRKSISLNRLAVMAAAVVLMSFSGCALGSKAIHSSRQKYNESVTRTDREELLLNIVRLRYRDTVSSLPVGSISTQFAWDYSAGAEGEVGPDASNLVGLGGNAMFSERPTVSYRAPGAELFRSTLQPLRIETLFLLSYTGSPIEQVFRIVAKGMNNVTNVSIAGGPAPEEVSEFQKFAWMLVNLEELSRRGHVELGRVTQLEPISYPLQRDSLTEKEYRTADTEGYVYLPAKDDSFVVLHKKEQETVLRFAPAALASREYAEIARTLGLRPGLLEYIIELSLAGQVIPQSVPDGGDRILVNPRSLLEIASLLANGVEVPPSHAAKGLAVVTRDHDGRPFDWQQVLKETFRVGAAKFRPHNAAVAVKYRGHWFFIDDRDHASKATFLLLAKLYALEVQAGGPEMLPILTLPVGR